jgi:hypothetical protein
MIGGIAWCELMNYKYVHTSFQKAAYFPIRNTDKWDKFVGIPIERRVEDFLKNKRITKKEDENIDIIEDRQKILWHLKKTDKFFIKKVLKEIKKHYYSTPKPAIKKYDIAIHIRRGDVTFNRHNERFTANKNYVPLIKFLKRKYPNYSICIYSQGKREEFQELKIPGISFDLNSETTEVFHNFVQAKVLVTSKSNFSYAAALLSDNTIYFMPFWYYPLKHWKVISDNLLVK